MRDETRKGSPTGIGISLHQQRSESPQSPYQQQQQQTYQPHHFHDHNEYERQRQNRLSQINRRSTREVQPSDQAVPTATNTSRQDEAVIKRR